MKIIGRRWAKLSEVMDKNYVPQLNQSLNQQQGGSQMNQGQQNQLQSQVGAEMQSQQQSNIGGQPIMYGPGSNISQMQNQQPKMEQGGSNDLISQQYQKYYEQQQLEHQMQQYQSQQLNNNSGYNQNNMQNAPYGYNEQTNSYYPIPNNTNNSQNERVGGYTRYTHEYLLDNGQIVTTEQAYDLAMQGLIEGVSCSSNKGTKYIRSVGDGNMKNNLDDLPEF